MSKWNGPWSMDKYGCINDADGEKVEVSGLSLVCGYRRPDDPAFAKTRLIAAAPEMAELLAEFVGMEHLFMDSGQFHQAVYQASALLAKINKE